MSFLVKWHSLFLALAMAVPASAEMVLHLDFNDPGQVGKAMFGDDLEPVGDAVYTAAGKEGGGLLLDGVGDYLRLNASDALPSGVPTGDSSYTIAAFFKTTVEARNGIVGWGAPATGQFNGTRTADTVNTLDDFSFINYSWGAEFDCPATLDPSSFPAGYADGQWHHLAAVYDSAASEKRIYFDGALVTTVSMASNLNVANANFRLGTIHHPYGDEDFNGTLDDVRIYDTALTGIQIDELTSVPEPSTCLSLFAMISAGVFVLRRR